MNAPAEKKPTDQPQPALNEVAPPLAAAPNPTSTPVDLPVPVKKPKPKQPTPALTEVAPSPVEAPNPTALDQPIPVKKPKPKQPMPALDQVAPALAGASQPTTSEPPIAKKALDEHLKAEPPAPLPSEAFGTGAAKANAAEVRRARSRRLLKRLGAFVVLPTVGAAAYYGLVARSQFESYSTFTVQSSEARQTFGGMEGLLAGITASGGHDALAVRDYALSRDMLALLDKQEGFIGHYREPSRDWLSRLSGSASFEDAYEYYGSKVYADYDQTSGAVTLRVRAFTPEKAQAFAKSLLAGSEAMVNKLSERQRFDRTRSAEAELKLAEARLQSARKAIVALQQKHKDFSPLQTAGAAMEIRTVLEGELAKARAELMQLKSFMNENAPQVLAANEKIKSLAAQVAGESRRLVGPKETSGLGASLVDFEAGMTEKEFAEKAYASTLAALELAKADADRQHRYLAVIAGPSKPDEATYPHRIRSVISAFVLSFLLLGVVSLLGAAVREHARL